MDRVEEFGSGWDPGGDPTFPPPYLAGYSEFQRTRRLDGSAVITRSAIVDRLRFGSRLLMDEHRCPPGISLFSGMPSMAVPILIITGPVAVSVRLLPFDRTGGFRYLRYLRDPWWLGGLWWLWRYSTYLVAGFTWCSAADRTESGHDPRPIFSLVLTMVRSWCIFIYGLSPSLYCTV